MNRQIQPLCLNLRLSQHFDCFGMADNPYQPRYRTVLVNQRLGLVAFKFSGVILVTPEVTRLQKLPIHLIQVSQVIVISGQP